MALAITVEMPSGEHIALPCKYRASREDDNLPGDLWELAADCGCVYRRGRLWTCQRHPGARNPRPHRLT